MCRQNGLWRNHISIYGFWLFIEKCATRVTFFGSLWTLDKEFLLCPPYLAEVSFQHCNNESFKLDTFWSPWADTVTDSMPCTMYRVCRYYVCVKIHCSICHQCRNINSLNVEHFRFTLFLQHLKNTYRTVFMKCQFHTGTYKNVRHNWSVCLSVQFF